MLLVGHTQLKELVPADVAALTPARVAIDCVNGWDAGSWQAAGFTMYKLGVRKEQA